ncbi:MAG: LEA type 2 family protein [Magnetococcales bacterium]|nr:LEA type 2 family protein [Magnetococcales bacterium]MBF0347663.1 LEA type 2 family protein [Magnetococcales bacterium]MBF0631238.1 LEA type 2 family protein [Magnetococcales bacterium]
MSWRNGVSLMALTFLLLACTTPKFSIPGKLEVELVEIEPKKFSLSHQEFRVRLKVNNPNADDIPIAALHAAIVLSGFEFSNVHTSKPFTVKAHDQIEFDVPVRTSLMESCDEVKALFKARQKELVYELRGTIKVDRPFTDDVTFVKSGWIDLKQKLEGSIN